MLENFVKLPPWKSRKLFLEISTKFVKYCVVKLSTVHDQTGRVKEIGGGKYLWLGSFESIRVGWKLRLNVDMANKPAYEKGKYLSRVLIFIPVILRPNEK